MTAREPQFLLALESSTAAGSVAVGKWIPGAGGGDPIELCAMETLPEERAQASRMIPAIDRVLREAGIRPSGLTGIVAGAGPGSFTGVRVSAATAKGLRAAVGARLHAPSSLLAGAVRAPWPEGDAPPLLVLFDARADRVFAALTGRVEGRFILLGPSEATTIPALLDRRAAGALPAGVRAAGEGAIRHRGVLEGAGIEVLDPPAGIPDAAALLRLVAQGGPEAAEVSAPELWVPDYRKGSSAVPRAQSENG